MFMCFHSRRAFNKFSFCKMKKIRIFVFNYKSAKWKWNWKTFREVTASEKIARKAFTVQRIEENGKLKKIGVIFLYVQDGKARFLRSSMSCLTDFSSCTSSRPKLAKNMNRTEEGEEKEEIYCTTAWNTITHNTQPNTIKLIERFSYTSEEKNKNIFGW